MRQAPVRLLCALLLGAAVSFFAATSTHATGLRIAPLMHKEALAEGEVKKGFVDITNPTGSNIVVTTDVKAFKQTDNEGSLQFYESEQMSAGIKTDLTEFELGPRETVRMYFSVDGTKLPQGDVFGAIFATTKQAGDTRGIVPAAQVGTLVILENGAPGERAAEITSLNVPTFHFGESVNGSLRVKNVASVTTASGFFPEVAVTMGPVFAWNKTLEGPLIFAGIERPINFSLPTNRIGFYQVTASVGDSQAEKWIFVVTGWWRWVVLGVLFLGVAAAILAYKKLQKHVRYKRLGKKE